jgi:hypothetical protein
MAQKHILLQLQDGISDTTPAVVDEVKLLQKLLKEWGMLGPSEAVDGKFGNHTNEAVKSFQQNKSLQVDGKVGQNTWAALLKVSPSEVEIIHRPSGAASSGHAHAGFTGNKLIIYNELKKHNFSDVQCAAILGCWQQESSFNPYAQEPSPGTGLGLAQWSGSRRGKVPAFTHDVATDIRNQVKLFVDELNTTETRAGNTLRSATTLAEAMEGMKQFERFGIAGRRQEFAEQILNELQNIV